MTEWSLIAQRAQANGVRTPAVVLDEQTTRDNIQAMQDLLDGTNWSWRAHVKTARSRWAMSLLVDAGVSSFKCSTIGEAEALIDVGASDILLAVVPTRERIHAMVDLARSSTARLSVLVDSAEQLSHVDGSARLGVFIDLDTGMGRTGVPVDQHERVLLLARHAEARAVPLRGLHSYDGHLAGVDVRERERTVARDLRRVSDLANALNVAGLPVTEIVAGSTHTAHQVVHATAPSNAADLTVGAGTLVYCDVRSLERFAEDGTDAPQGFAPAAVVLGTTTSVEGTRVTVDCGTTVLQHDAGLPPALVVHPSGVEYAFMGQEHLVLTDADCRIRIGDSVVILPRHVDTSISQVAEAVVHTVDGQFRRVGVVGRH